MSMVETIRDVKNDLLSRREITCTFKGLAGKLKKLEAVDIVSKQYKLDGKVIIPIVLKNETGRPTISGTFYVYEDEKMARAHLKLAIFERLEKAKGGGEKTEETKEAPPKKAAKEKPEEKKEAPVEKKEVKTPEKKEAKESEEKKEKPTKKESVESKEKSK